MQMLQSLFRLAAAIVLPLEPYAALVWLGGLVCLWLSQHTHTLGERWGRAYHLCSAVLRPAGILLVGLGWFAAYVPRCSYWQPATAGMHWPPLGPVAGLAVLGAAGFAALGLWAVATLGLRRSLLFQRVDDGLVTRGPYAWVRHPAYLAALGIALCGALYCSLGRVFIGNYCTECRAPFAEWWLFAVAFWVLAILEDRELAAHYGAGYEAYARRVPRLFPG